MAETYWVIMAKEQEASLDLPAEPKFEKSKILASPESTVVVKLEAENVAEAQRTVEHFYAGQVTNTPIVVTEAQFKES
jgi:hypothetical protein